MSDNNDKIAEKKAEIGDRNISLEEYLEFLALVGNWDYNDAEREDH